MAKSRKFKQRRINLNYFNIFKEIPLLFKVSLNNRLSRHIENPNRILVVNTCLIGDFISTLPALTYFIDKHDACVDLVVSPSVELLSKRIKGVNEVFTAKSIYNRDAEKAETIKPIFGNYDLVLLMRLSKASSQVLKQIKYNKIRSYIGPYLKYGFYLAGNLSNKRTIKQWSEINFEIVGAKGINKRALNFDDIFRFEKSDFYRINELGFLKGNEKKIIVHTGSGWPIKLWGNENWVELLQKISELGRFKFIFIGGSEEEKEDFKYIKKNLSFEIHSTINKFDISETALIMKKCNYFIGVDSGPRHLAHLVNLTSICLLGPGPNFFKPLNNNSTVLDKSDCMCTNFFCYRKKTCIEKIGVGDVFHEFRKIYNRRQVVSSSHST